MDDGGDETIKGGVTTISPLRDLKSEASGSEPTFVSSDEDEVDAMVTVGEEGTTGMNGLFVPNDPVDEPAPLPFKSESSGYCAGGQNDMRLVSLSYSGPRLGSRVC